MSYNNIKERFVEQGSIIDRDFLYCEKISGVKRVLENLLSSNSERKFSNHVVNENRNNPGVVKQFQNLQKSFFSFGEMLINNGFGALVETLVNEKVIGQDMEYFNMTPKAKKRLYYDIMIIFISCVPLII